MFHSQGAEVQRWWLGEKNPSWTRGSLPGQTSPPPVSGRMLHLPH